MGDTEQYSIEFNQEEIEKLKRISEVLRATAGQNEEYVELATWLMGIVSDDDGEETPDKPKRKKKK